MSSGAAEHKEDGCGRENHVREYQFLYCPWVEPVRFPGRSHVVDCHPDEMTSPCRTRKPPQPSKEGVMTLAELEEMTKWGTRQIMEEENLFNNLVYGVNRRQILVDSNNDESEKFSAMVQSWASSVMALEREVHLENFMLLELEQVINNLPEPNPVVPGYDTFCRNATYAIAVDAKYQLVQMKDGVGQLQAFMTPPGTDLVSDDPVHQILRILDVSVNILTSIERQIYEANYLIETIKNLHDTFLMTITSSI